MASINGSPATSVLVAINILFFLGVELTGGAGKQNLLKWGAKHGPDIAEGEYWRLFLPMFLHVDFFHMLMNLFGLVIFGRMVERIFGTRDFVVVYLTAGIMGNVTSYLAGPNYSVGASGAVSGILGAFGVYLLLNRRLLGHMGRQELTSIGVIVAINIVFGLTIAGIDNAAHFGGFLAGGFVAWLIAPRQRLFAVENTFNFGSQRMALTPGDQSTSKLVLAIVVIAAVAVVVTWFVSQSY
jgi:rhomboid protease GluP